MKAPKRGGRRAERIGNFKTLEDKNEHHNCCND